LRDNKILIVIVALCIVEASTRVYVRGSVGEEWEEV